MLRKTLVSIIGALAITIGIAGTAHAAIGTTTNTLGSGANHVANTALKWTTNSSGWYIDNTQDVRVWNPSGNDHGTLYAAVYFPAAAAYVNCPTEASGSKTDDYYYMGVITDGNTKIAGCAMGVAPASANVKVQIESIGESGGRLGLWCVTIRPNVHSVAAGAC